MKLWFDHIVHGGIKVEELQGLKDELLNVLDLEYLNPMCDDLCRSILLHADLRCEDLFRVVFHSHILFCVNLDAQG